MPEKGPGSGASSTRQVHFGSGEYVGQPPHVGNPADPAPAGRPDGPFPVTQAAIGPAEYTATLESLLGQKMVMEHAFHALLASFESAGEAIMVRSASFVDSDGVPPQTITGGFNNFGLNTSAERSFEGLCGRISLEERDRFVAAFSDAHTADMALSQLPQVPAAQVREWIDTIADLRSRLPGMSPLERAQTEKDIASIAANAGQVCDGMHIVGRGYESKDDFRMRNVAGTDVVVSIRQRVVFEERGRFTSTIDIRDATERLNDQERKRFLRVMERRRDLTDQMTSLWRREVVMEQAQRVWNDPVRRKRAALVLVDSDGMKQINDKFGHKAGDTLLSVSGRRYKGCFKVKQTDQLAFDALYDEKSDIAGRIGGDEFLAVLVELPEDGDPDDVLASIGLRVMNRMSEPIREGNLHMEPSFSVGISMATDTQSFEDWVDSADLAMYEAKFRSKARANTSGIQTSDFEIYDPSKNYMEARLLQQKAKIEEANERQESAE